MSTVPELLAKWEAETLSGAEQQQLLGLLETEAGQRELVDQFMFAEAVFSALSITPPLTPEPPAPQTGSTGHIGSLLRWGGIVLGVGAVAAAAWFGATRPQAPVAAPPPSVPQDLPEPAPVAMPQQPANLLANPGFEEALSVWHEHYTQNRLEVVALAHQGRGALHIVLDAGEESIAAQTFSVSQGEVYEAACWIRTSKFARRGAASLRLYWFDSRQRKVSTSSIGIVGGTADWTRVADQVVVPRGAATVQFSLHAFTHENSIECWFDDCELLKMK